jgi:hypothetical protein
MPMLCLIQPTLLAQDSTKAAYLRKQQPDSRTDSSKLFIKKDSTAAIVVKPVHSPRKAALYSAVLPGLGQIYNHEYWKLPLVYGAMGASIYYYSWNNKKYHEYRDAYKVRISGGTPKGLLAGLDEQRLISGQKFHQKNRDLSALLTALFYVTQIVEANVNAHLMQFNVNENLSMKPNLQQNDIDNKYNMGLKLSFQF